MPEARPIVPAWIPVLEAIKARPGRVVVVGGSDSGKTTWVGRAASWLAREGALPLALVDADIGQSSVGPPGAVALRVLREPGREVACDQGAPTDALAFVGSVSPTGHALQLVTATTRLVERAEQAGAAVVLVDTTGLIAPGFGFQVKLRKIELIKPAHLIAFQRGAELEPLLRIVHGRRDLEVHRLPVSDSVSPRGPAERAAYRTARWRTYFTLARTVRLPVSQVLVAAPPARRLRSALIGDIVEAGALREPSMRGLLVGLNTADDETVSVGWLEGVSEDGAHLQVRAPLGDPRDVRILQLGSVWVHASGQNPVGLEEEASGPARQEPRPLGDAGAQPEGLGEERR